MSPTGSRARPQVEVVLPRHSWIIAIGRPKDLSSGDVTRSLGFPEDVRF